MKQTCTWEWYIPKVNPKKPEINTTCGHVAFGIPKLGEYCQWCGGKITEKSTPAKSKIIFLDIDGVLCTNRSHSASMIQTGMMESLDSVGIGLLNNICATTEAQIVISSTWRILHTDIPMMFRMCGFRGAFHPAWKTPDAFNKDTNKTLRGDDINQWFEEHGKHEYIIIDDDSDFHDDQKERLILTKFDDGISFQNFRDALDLLLPDEVHFQVLKDKLPLGWRSAYKQKQMKGEENE